MMQAASSQLAVAAQGAAVFLGQSEPLEIWREIERETRGATKISGCPALVLNADYRPLSTFPLSLWSAQDAIKAVCADRVDTVETYDLFVRSPSLTLQVPSVIALKKYQPLDRPPAFTRFNVFLRDRFCCQYCADAKSRPSTELTFDHVLPRARGGKTSWTNIVTACAPCNLRKGSKLLKDSGMVLRTEPVRPKMAQLQVNGQNFPPRYLHNSWRDYVYWDIELEP